MTPEGWKRIEIGKAGRVVTGSTPPTANRKYYNGAIPFASPADLNGQRYVKTTIKTLTEEGFSVSRPIPAGASLFVCIASIGKVAQAAVNLATNQQINAVIPKPETDADFLFYALLHRSKYIARLAGKQAVPLINKSQFSVETINLPPSQEQRKIAEILSTWDRAIETTEALLANARARKRALMQQLLTGKRRFPEFKGQKWREVRLGDVGSISSAGVDKKSNQNEPEVRLLNFLDVFRREFIHDHELDHAVTAPNVKVRKCNVRRGDVFFTPSSETRDEIAIPAVAAEDMPGVCYSYHIVRFRLQEDWDTNFRAFIFQTDDFRRQAYRLGDGSGQRYVISQDTFRKMTVCVPRREEQKRIGEVLRSASDEIGRLESDIEKLRSEKKALMQQLLTGKRRVKVKTAQSIPIQQRRRPMPNEKNYWTQQRPDGKWESKREGAGRAGKVADTQAEAWEYSKRQATDKKGEAFLKGRDGKIRERNTYGKDPYPPKG